MDAEKLFKTVVDKYNQPEEVEFLVEIIEGGLYPYEEEAIKKYWQQGGKVLDIGCGAGREAIAFARLGYDVAGIDTSKLAIKKAKEAIDRSGIASNIDFKLMKAWELNFPDDSFDYAAMFSQLISCIPTRALRIKTLKEVKRVLKKDGILIFSTHSRYMTFSRKFRWFFIDGARSIKKKIFNLPSLEAGDKFATDVSGRRKTSLPMFMHIYTMQEGVEDICASGLGLVDVLCSKELQGIPVRRKENNRYLFFIACKV